jgi:hypothetical protein
MESPSRLLLEFSSSGLVSNGELYLPLEAARRLVERCREKSIAILGVEAFDVLAGKIRPRVDLIADFSDEFDRLSDWNETVARTTQDALSFLDAVAHGAPTLHLSFIFKTNG